MSTGLLGSGSKLRLTLHCPTALWLPQAPKPEHVEAAANRGKELHLYLENGRLDETQPEHHEDCLGIDLSTTAGKNAPPTCREIKFVYDCEKRKARIHWSKEARDYGDLKPSEVSATADVVIPGFHLFEVHDYKTGKQADKPEDNPQLLFLALCTKLTLCPFAKYALLGIQHVKKLKSGITTPTKSVLIDNWTLSVFQEELHKAYEKATAWRQAFDSGRILVKRGDQCWKCDARKAGCPAWKR